MASPWREIAEPIILGIIRKYPDDCPERRKALRDAYPFGVRKHWPYKVWLKLVAEYTGKRSTPTDGVISRIWPDQHTLV